MSHSFIGNINCICDHKIHIDQLMYACGLKNFGVCGFVISWMVAEIHITIKFGMDYKKDVLFDSKNQCMML